MYGESLVGDTDEALPLHLVPQDGCLDEILYDRTAYRPSLDEEAVAGGNRTYGGEKALHVLQARITDIP